MNKFTYLFLLFSILAFGYGCSDNQDLPHHGVLLGSQSIYVGEPMDPEAAKYNKLANSDKVKIEMRDHYIIATTWYIVNACGNYIPNLVARNDTLELTYNQTSDELCMSLSIKEATYFIDNRDDKNWVIIK